jgi:hypothetical protein
MGNKAMINVGIDIPTGKFTLKFLNVFEKQKDEN